MEDKKLNIYEKMSKVMEDIEYLQKDDKVITNQKTGAGYKAVSEEKVTGEVRKALIKYGIVIIPIDQNHKREDEVLKDQYGSEKVSRLTTVDTKYRIQNIDDKDDYVIGVSSGTGVDTQDKGIGKAMTYSYKYLLLRSFAIPTGEDTDKISSEEYDSQFNRNEKSTKKVSLATESQIKIIKEKLNEEQIKVALDLVKKEKLEELTVLEASSLIKKIGGEK